jgi:hypothetical protein
MEHNNELSPQPELSSISDMPLRRCTSRVRRTVIYRARREADRLLVVLKVLNER